MLERGFTLFRIRNIPIRLHFTLLLFIPYVAVAAAREYTWMARYRDMSPGDLVLPPIVWGALLAIGLFASVLAHELGHSLVAMKSGARVNSITLMMLGGVSQISGTLEPRREAWMAFAGPLVSFAIAAVSFAAFRFLHVTPEVGVALFAFAWMNALLGAFNLLPAFPMDGGRVLRGLLTKRLGCARATRLTTTLGRAFAVFFGLWGLVSYNVILVLIALFVYLGASAERTRIEQRDALAGRSVVDIVSGRLGEADAHETVGDVARRLLRLDLNAAKVTETDPEDHHRTLGVVTATELFDAATHGKGAEPIASAVRTDLPSVPLDADGGSVLDLLTTEDRGAAVVVDPAGEIVGVVTPADVERAIALGAIHS